MLKKLLLRDVLFALAVFAGWLAFAGISAGTGLLSDFVGVSLGVALGIVANQAHEWGHIVGALISKSTFKPGSSFTSLSNFVYDSKANSRGQFLVMSFGGFIVTGFIAWFYLTGLPADLLATRVAHGSILFLVGLGVFLELPLVLYSLVTNKVPPVDRSVV